MKSHVQKILVFTATLFAHLNYKFVIPACFWLGSILFSGSWIKALQDDGMPPFAGMTKTAVVAILLSLFSLSSFADPAKELIYTNKHRVKSITRANIFNFNACFSQDYTLYKATVPRWL